MILAQNNCQIRIFIRIFYFVENRKKEENDAK